MKAEQQLIAISGKSGCGNTTVGNLVAAKLGWQFINFTFRQLAAEKKMSFVELSKQAASDESIDRQLDQRQLELAATGCAVLSSRLAIWLLPQAPLRVYLQAGLEARSRRVQQREGRSLTIQKQLTLARDEQDSQRYKHLYNIDNNSTEKATLVLNTEELSAQQCAQLIVLAWQVCTGKDSSQP